IRENVTISRGTASKGSTNVGNNNLLMENMHIAHDCVVGNGCIIGNSTKLAGEVVIDDNAIISATVLVHQFCKVGGFVMIQGGSRTSQDIPPYVMAGKEPIRFAGVNLIGLRRRGYSNELIQLIHEAYRLLYSKGVLAEGIEEIKKNIQVTPEIQYIIDFVSTSKRGIIR
ncbi:MAG: acyl-[Prevotella sp.]|nr:acyl-[acyl-carrier-protein]--UDP-N-acetylglucosamine O-acyltransferase [Prevotella sp.]